MRPRSTGIVHAVLRCLALRGMQARPREDPRKPVDGRRGIVVGTELDLRGTSLDSWIGASLPDRPRGPAGLAVGPHFIAGPPAFLLLA